MQNACVAMSDLSTGIYRAKGAQTDGEPQRAYRGRKGTNAYVELAQGDEVEIAETYRRQNGACWGRITSINGQASEGFAALMSKDGVMKMDPVSSLADVKDNEDASEEDASEEEREGLGDVHKDEQASATADMLQQLRDAAALQEEAARKAREELEKKEQEEAERKVRDEAARKERLEAERKAKEESDQRMREEAAKKATKEAERKIREEAEEEVRRHLAEQKAREDAELEAQRHAAEESRRAMIGSLKVPIAKGEDFDPPLFGENSGQSERESPPASPRYAEDARGPGGHHTLGFLAVSGVVAGLLVPIFPGHRAKQALALGALCAFAGTRDDVLGHVLRKAGRSGVERSRDGHETLRRASIQAKAGAGRASVRAQSRVQSRVQRLDLRSLQLSVLFPLGEAVFAIREATSLSKLGITQPGLK